MHLVYKLLFYILVTCFCTISLNIFVTRKFVSKVRERILIRIHAVASDMFKVYCADHTYTTVRVRYDDTAQTVVEVAKERLLLEGDCVLCEVKSTGGKLT